MLDQLMPYTLETKEGYVIPVRITALDRQSSVAKVYLDLPDLWVSTDDLSPRNAQETKEWIQVESLGKCRLNYPLMIEVRFISNEYWVTWCPTVSAHAIGKTREEALDILGEIILTDIASLRKPEPKTEDAEHVLKFLELLVKEE